MNPKIRLAEYLFTRLAQLGVRSVHGVPGDYNLTCLDYIAKTGLHWVGNANELNAGYAADGYARVKGVSALITSFGVGELSAINAIAGAYAEKSPVVHIVGTPPRASQVARACLHHTLGDGNFRAFADVYKTFTVAQANIDNVENATRQIDSILRECIMQSRPVYIEIPTELVHTCVKGWTEPLDFVSLEYNEYLEDEIVQAVTERIYDSKQPMILVDGFAARFGVREELNDLVELTNFPTLVAPFGKSLIDEDLPNFMGIHSGLAGEPAQRAWVKGCDLVLHFGSLPSDVNNFGFTTIPETRATLTFDKCSVTDGDLNLPPGALPGRRIYIKSFLQKLLARLEKAKILAIQSPYPGQHPTLQVSSSTSDSHSISQSKFWPYISTFLRSGDIVLTETGTSASGGQSLILPPRTTLMNSFIWLSIGHMLGACQGVALAQREIRRSTVSDSPITGPIQPHHRPFCPIGRTIIFVGDGSLQMSAQIISDIIRNRLDVIIFILNNSRYTIERIIHGFNESYNDVQPWRNLKAPEYFGAPEDDPDYRVRTRKVESWSQLHAVMTDTEVEGGDGLNMIEIVMDMGDAPKSLQKFVDYLEKRNNGDTVDEVL